MLNSHGSWLEKFMVPRCLLFSCLNSQMQAQIIKESISHLTDAGLEVHGVTFDGCAKNLATARYLGCKINQFDGYFKHPSRPNKTLHVILDILDIKIFKVFRLNQAICSPTAFLQPQSIQICSQSTSLAMSSFHMVLGSHHKL